MGGMSVIRSMSAVVLSAALLHAAETAQASGTYVVESCRTANGPAPTHGWRAIPLPWASSDTLVGDDCAREGIRFLAGPLQSRTVLGTEWVFDAPPGTSVAGVRLRRYATLPGQANAAYGIRVGEQTIEQSPQWGPWTFGSEDAADEVVATGLHGPDVAVAFACFAGSSNCPGSGWKVVIARAAVTLRDETAPRLSGSPSGALLDGGVLSGNVRAHVAYSDIGGGVDTVELLVDGVTRSAVRVGGPTCVAPYLVAVPCALQGELELTLDADQLSGGTHQLALALTDVAGNRAVAGPYVISVRAAAFAPAPAAPSGAEPPTVGPTPGTLSVTGKRTRRITFSAQRLLGRVFGTTGAVSGGRVLVTTRPLRGDAWTPLSVVTTGRDGRFSVSLPRGPSREVRVSYGASVQTIKLIVAAPVRLTTNRRSTRNGRSIRFSGTVPGTEGARTRVELQAWAGRWVPFKSAALRNGRFSASYRFTSTYAKTRYRFRAVIHDDDDFPYAGGTSPEVEVVVRP